MLKPKDKKVLIQYGLFNALLLLILTAPFLLITLKSQSLFQNSVIHYQKPLLKFFLISYALFNHCTFIILIATSFIGIAFILKRMLKISTKILLCLLFISYSLLTCIFVTDYFLYKNYQFHLDIHLISLIHSSIFYHVFELSITEKFLIVFFVLSAFIIQIFFIKICTISTFQNSSNKKLTFFLFHIPILIQLSCLIFLGLSLQHQNPILIQQTQNIPFYQPLLKMGLSKDNAKKLSQLANQGLNLPQMNAPSLNYPKPIICQPEKNPKNLIVILVDALRFDAITPKAMPKLFKQSQEMFQFTDYFSGGNSTQAGLFSLFYGLPPNYWYAFLNEPKAPLLHQLLKAQGYHSMSIWSAQNKAPRFDKTLLLAIDEVITNYQKSDKVKDWDKATSQQAKKFIQQKQSPFYLQLFYRAPHSYCYKNEFNTPFKPTANPCQRLFGEKIKHEYYNRYLNALYFIDNEITKVIDALKENGLWQNSVVVISSDHGEEFDDNQLGYWGHTSNFSKHQTQVPLLIHWPNKRAKIINNRHTHYDLHYTLLTDFLGCEDKAHLNSVGTHLFDEKSPPYFWLGSYNDFALMTLDKTFHFSRQGELLVYDKNQQPTPLHPQDKMLLNEAMNQLSAFN